MKYLKFKTAYSFRMELLETNITSYKAFYKIQALFDVSFKHFYMSNNYKSALVYDTIFQEFKILIENCDMTQSEKLIAGVSIYKKLFIEHERLLAYNNYMKSA